MKGHDSAVRRALHVASTESLPGREQELETLGKFLLQRSQGVKGAPGAAYVSGPPGTGKTACIQLVISQMREEFSSGFINCTFVKTLSALLKKIAEEFEVNLPAGATIEQMETIIHKHLKRKNSRKAVLVLDEVDQLEGGRGQKALYRLFEWPLKLGHSFTLIGIANALDLTQRALPRLGARGPSSEPLLLPFAPYTKQQLLEVLRHRLLSAGASGAFDAAALELLAAKVASVSGDARRALDLGRRALEVGGRKRPSSVLGPANDLDKALENRVGPMHVRKVLDSVFGGIDQGPQLPLQHQIVLACLLLLKRPPVKKATIGKLHEVYSGVCNRRKLGAVGRSELLHICQLLEAEGAVRVTGAGLVALQWDHDEVSDALSDKSLLADILRS
ncbi:cell division control protein 6 homolog [Neocloeon triangulifer]|uniref:cell division control protein 6 homolog n=1 Tax=Neocloeon triangulifer TaxID=2078957 RepID=UPI00286EC31B|nr:cell division control protein 6 homolog [Neocloeon triangulifer]